MNFYNLHPPAPPKDYTHSFNYTYSKKPEQIYSTALNIIINNNNNKCI